MNPDDLRELARLMAIQSQAAARQDCSTCRHSVYCDLQTAQNLREKEGYAQGMGAYRHDKGFVCAKFRIVAPTPCQGYERSPRLEAPS